MLRLAATLGDAVSMRELSVVARLPTPDVVNALAEAFRAQLLDDEGDTLVFRHQLVHDAIYQETPPVLRRALHRDAAGALAASGANPLRVADQVIRGAERGDLGAVDLLRSAAREAAAAGPAASVELLKHAGSLLPARHPQADVVSGEIVDALLRSGHAAEAAGRATAVLDRARRPDLDIPLRLSLSRPCRSSIEDVSWSIRPRKRLGGSRIFRCPNGLWSLRRRALATHSPTTPPPGNRQHVSRSTSRNAPVTLR